jgi:hypothetical protein
MHNPEILFFKNQLVNNALLNFSTTANISIIQHTGAQTLLTPTMLLPQLLFLTYSSFLFVAFYFSFYSTSSKEESVIDSDYLVAGTTVEAEKEIGSLDDMLMPLVVFIYVFGWYFYLYW